MDFSVPAEAIESLCGALTDEQVSLLHDYGRSVQEGSGRLNLVSRGERGNVAQHVVDSAALLSFRDQESGSLADLGSGAGFPGMVVAILRPGISVTLVEAKRRKVVFLKKVVSDLGLVNVLIHHGRIEEMAGRRTFDTAVVRALDDPLKMLPFCIELVAQPGALVLFKGPRWGEESEETERIASRSGFGVRRVERIPLPGSDRTTVFVELCSR